MFSLLLVRWCGDDCGTSNDEYQWKVQVGYAHEWSVVLERHDERRSRVEESAFGEKGSLFGL